MPQKVRHYLGHFLWKEKVTKPNPNYFFFDFLNHFKRSETAKLTIPPTTTKIVVFRISSERMLGTILNKVPDTVPVRREISVSITGLFWFSLSS